MYKLQYDDNGKVIVPETQSEKQDFLMFLWDHIIDNLDKTHITLYNKVAGEYNRKSGHNIMTTFNNNANLATMAKEKAAVKKAAPAKKAAAPAKKAGPVAPAKKDATKKATPKKDEAPVKNIQTPVKKGTGKKTQKELVSEWAAKGKTIDEVVEITGIQKTNVSYYFSKLKLHKKYGNEKK